MIHSAYSVMLGIVYKFRYNTSPFLLRDTVQMRVKTAPRLRLQPAYLPCQIPLLFSEQSAIQQTTVHDGIYQSSLSTSQQGATSWVLALFAATIMFTVIVGLIFGHNLGYNRGYHAQEAENKKAIDSGQVTTQELEVLRTSHKVLRNQVATAKQELTISLNNLDELRETQQKLNIENRQLQQLNELYAVALSKKGGLPLQVLGAKIEPLPENAFEYGFDIAMLSQDGQSKRLNTTLTILNDDDFVEVPLDPTSNVIKGVSRIRGRFIMPSNFKPLQVKLVLRSGGQSVEQLYDWRLGDRVDSMPLSLVDLTEVDQSPIDP